MRQAETPTFKSQYKQHQVISLELKPAVDSEYTQELNMLQRLLSY